MLQTKGLTFAYDSGHPISFPDFRCETGEHWLLLGQSGSGKTTLLHLLAGLRTPKSGSVQIGDRVLSELSGGMLDAFRGRNIGVIFQRSHFVRSLNVTENLQLAQSLAGATVDPDRIRQLLEQLNVGHKEFALPDALSMGEQQRVAIARAIVNQPAVILADEPTSALDDRNTDQVLALLKEQALAVNATLLIVTHDNRLIERFDKQIRL
jgi:ABC-type lipoprotein export system ATPase subunit